MSMLFDLRRVSNEEAISLIQDPADIFFFLHGNDPYELPKSFFQKLFSPKPALKTERSWQAPTVDMVLTLDKNWHVIHYLLSRTPLEGSLPQATLMSGDELGNIDVGYGVARLLKQQQICDFLDFLNTLKKENYASGISGNELEEKEIYGACPEWSQRDVDVIWDYIADLVSFFTKAKTNNECIIIYMY